MDGFSGHQTLDISLHDGHHTLVGKRVRIRRDAGRGREFPGGAKRAEAVGIDLEPPAQVGGGQSLDGIQGDAFRSGAERRVHLLENPFRVPAEFGVHPAHQRRAGGFRQLVLERSVTGEGRIHRVEVGVGHGMGQVQLPFSPVLEDHEAGDSLPGEGRCGDGLAGGMGGVAQQVRHVGDPVAAELVPGFVAGGILLLAGIVAVFRLEGREHRRMIAEIVLGEDFSVLEETVVVGEGDGQYAVD